LLDSSMELLIGVTPSPPRRGALQVANEKLHRSQYRDVSQIRPRAVRSDKQRRWHHRRGDEQYEDDPALPSDGLTPTPPVAFRGVPVLRRFRHAACLTRKLRGRAEAPASGAEGAQSPSARGAMQEVHHGPLERLLEDAPLSTIRARKRRTPDPLTPELPAEQKRRHSCAYSGASNEGSWPRLFNLAPSLQSQIWVRPLTGKLRGRTEAPACGAEGAQSLSARGARQEALHGPLQRWLEVTPRAEV
jgi:hypothetical protein